MADKRITGLTGLPKIMVEDADGTYMEKVAVESIEGEVDVSPAGDSDRVAFNRPANITAYLAGDVVGIAEGTTAALSFAVGPVGGGPIIITGASLEIDVSSVPAGMGNYRLELYNVTPPSALGDNAAWDLVAGDRAAYLGSLDLGTPVDKGSTLFTAKDFARPVVLASANLFAYLVTDGAYTPSSGARKVVTLHTIRP